ncbi:MAG: biotin carboxylase, partial [Candidatus Binatia bacterium]
LSPDDTFYFLEMNTRLQVEHPVTELVTGLDLVAEQLHIAAGNGLRLRQEDISLTGHAIECRISAEDPDHDFMPATGRVALLRAPENTGVRFDGGIREGQDITPSFDPMLAKLIVWGDNREAAIARMTRALEELVLLGVQTNADYLARIMKDEVFHAGALHTGFVVERAAALRPADVDDEMQAAALVAAALGVEDFRRLVYDVPEPYASINRWRN